MPIGRGGGADIPLDGGESEGFAAALDDAPGTEAPVLDTEAAGATLPVTSLSDGWAFGA